MVVEIDVTIQVFCLGRGSSLSNRLDLKTSSIQSHLYRGEGGGQVTVATPGYICKPFFVLYVILIPFKLDITDIIIIHT